MPAELSLTDAPHDRQPTVEELKRELADAQRREAATAEVLRIIRNSPTDVQPVFDTIVKSALRLCDGLFSSLFQFDGNLLHPVAHHNYTPEALEQLHRAYPRPPDRGGGTGRAILDRAIVQILDVEVDPEYQQQALSRAIGWRSGLFVPMLRDNTPIGVIMVARAAPGPFSRSEVELLRTFADQAVIAIENTRLFEEVQARTKELEESLEYRTATSEVLGVISRSPSDVQPVLESIVETARRLCSAERAIVWRLEDAFFQPMAFSGMDAERIDVVAQYRMPLGPDSVMGRAALAGRAVHAPDVFADPSLGPMQRALSSSGSIRSLLAVPLLKEGKPIGVITVSRTVMLPFTDRQIELVETFADQAVIAIENTRLFEEVQARTRELQESLQYQTATGDVLTVISKSPSQIQPVMEEISRTARTLCQADRAAIRLLDNGKFLQVAMDGAPFSADFEATMVDIPLAAGRDSVTGRVALEGRTVHVHDVQRDAELTVFHRYGADLRRTMLGVPLLRDATVIGVILLSRTEHLPFNDRQIKLVETFADQAVIAIENTRLFEAEQASKRELRESLEYQTATSDVLDVISRSPTNAQPVFDTIAQSAALLCEAQFCRVFRFDGELIHFAASHGVATEGLEAANKQYPMPPGRKSAAARAILTGAIEQIPDVEADPEYAIGRGASIIGFRSVVAVPMLKEGRPIGAIAVLRSQTGLLPERQIALLRTFADQAVIAIENARLFEEVQARTRELTEALEQQTATSEVLSVISSSPGELETVFKTMLANATRLCEAKFGIMWLRESDEFRCGALHNAPLEFAEERRREPVIRPHPQTPLGRVVRTKQVAHIHDITTEQAYAEGYQPLVGLAALGGARTIVAVPMLKDDELVGVIGIYRQEVRPFSAKQVALVSSFASQAVIAIENTRLLNELRESLQQQTATADVLKVISRSTFDLQAVLDTLVQSAARVCHADKANIARVEDNTLRFVAFSGFAPDYAKYMNNLSPRIDRGSISGRAVLDGDIVHVPDVLTDPEFTMFEAQKRGGFRTGLAVPLLVERKTPIGVFFLTRPSVDPFTQQQIDLVTTFADQAVIAIENTRLFEEVQARTREVTEALEYQTATSDVLSVISRSPSQVQPVFDTIAQTARRLCEAERASIWTLEDGAYQIAAVDGRRHGELEEELPKMRLGPDRASITGRVAIEKRVVHVLDLQADPELTVWKGTHIGSHTDFRRTMLGVPLLSQNAVVGVIILARIEVKPFAQRQIDLISTFADQAVIAIENTRLFEEVQARNRDLRIALEQQTATADLLKVIGRSTFDIQPVFETLAENTVRLCEAERAFIFRFDGHFLRVVATHNVNPDFRRWVEQNPIVPGRHSATARTALERRTIHIPDVLADPEYTYGAKQVDPIRTVLTVPMLRAGELLGVLLTYRHEVRPFTESQIALLESFADQAAIAIENTRLFEEVQARNRDLTALGEVGRAVSSTLDLKLVLKTIVDRAVALSGTDAGSIFYFREDIGRFELGETAGLGADVIARFRKLDIAAGQTGLGEAIASGKPLQVADIMQRPSNALRDAAMEAGLRAALIVPLLSAGAPLGALVLQRGQPGEFSQAVVSLMQSFADQSAIALENARLFNEIAQKSRELEIASQHKSQFVANMSHELRTPLAAILGYAELMQEGFYGTPSEKSMDALTRIRSNGKHLLGLINTVLDIAKIESGQFSLSLAEYAVESVVETVRAATESLAETKKLALKTDVAKSLPFGLGDEQRLTQVLLNLVGNAIKFTDTGEVCVTASAANSHFTVSVTDTGPGIPADQLTRVFEQFHQVDSSNTKAKGGTGLGLAISKQIVEMHGGRIWVESSLGKGSTFHMQLPVRAASKGAS